MLVTDWPLGFTRLEIRYFRLIAEAKSGRGAYKYGLEANSSSLIFPLSFSYRSLSTPRTFPGVSGQKAIHELSARDGKSHHGRDKQAVGLTF
jgi:hypothetical protein